MVVRTVDQNFFDDGLTAVEAHESYSLGALMLTWLRRFLTDSEDIDRRLNREFASLEERLSRRIYALEQRLDDDEKVLRRLGHQISRLEGRASVVEVRDTTSEGGSSVAGP